MELREYRVSDAEVILSWITDSDTHYRWSAGLLGDYPLKAEQFHQVLKEMPFVALEESELVGCFVFRRVAADPDTLRLSYVTVDNQKRGHGYGQTMIKLALEYARDHYGAKRVSLGVFDDNVSAYRCYEKIGFTYLDREQWSSFPVLGEDWLCREMEYFYDIES